MTSSYYLKQLKSPTIGQFSHQKDQQYGQMQMSVFGYPTNDISINEWQNSKYDNFWSTITRLQHTTTQGVNDNDNKSQRFEGLAGGSM